MDEQRLFATGTNPTASPENQRIDDAMQAEIDAGLRKFGEPRQAPHKYLPDRWSRCPSTHCERAQECRSPNECSAAPPKAAPGGWREAIEAAANVAEAEAASMRRVAEFHQPPRVDGDTYIADLHDQGEIVAQRIAEAIRALTSRPPEDKGRADIAAEVPEGDGGEVNGTITIDSKHYGHLMDCRSAVEDPGFVAQVVADARAAKALAEDYRAALDEIVDAFTQGASTYALYGIAKGTLLDGPGMIEREPGTGWKLSQETLAELAALDHFRIDSTKTPLHVAVRDLIGLISATDCNIVAADADKILAVLASLRLNERANEWGGKAELALEARAEAAERALAASRAEVDRLEHIIRCRDEQLTAETQLSSTFAADLLASRARADALAGALERAANAMHSVTVFVTSKERIKRPEGEEWWQAEIAAARSGDRSFPEAGDGRPISDTQAELFGAGCDPETARFVARQLERKGLVVAALAKHAGAGEEISPKPLSCNELYRKNSVEEITQADALAGALEPLVKQYEYFSTTSGNQADAYYCLVKGRHALWQAATAALAERAGSKGGE